MIEPRDYQREAIDSIYQYFKTNSGNPLVVLPPGAGKSVVIAVMLKEIFANWPSQRVLMLTHVKELVGQNYIRLRNAWPNAPVGINCSSLRRKDTRDSIIFASIQSVYKKAYEIGRFDLVIVDEAHLIPNSGDGMYRTLLSSLSSINPLVKVIGLTATPFRMKTGHLISKDSVFTDICCNISIKQLVKDGWLCPLIPKPTSLRINTDGVKIVAGEYSAKGMQEACDKEEITKAAVEEALTLSEGRRACLHFCAGIEHAEHVAHELTRHGERATFVHSKMTSKQRDSAIKGFKNGTYRHITNSDILTTGHDVPFLDCITLLRKTMSPGLLIQMCGRGFRPFDYKENCLVLDFANNLRLHGPIDLIEMEPQTKKKKRGEAPEKNCPVCFEWVAAQVKTCPYCGHKFEFEENPPHDPTAANDAILSFDEKPNIVRADRMSFTRHIKEGSPDSIKVTWMNGELPIAQEWLCLSHTGTARRMAMIWWGKIFKEAAPSSTNDALAVLAMKNISPIALYKADLTITKKGKYNRVTNITPVNEN